MKYSGEAIQTHVRFCVQLSIRHLGFDLEQRTSSWLYLLHSPGDLSSVWGCAYLNQPLQGHLHPPDHQPNLHWNEKQFCFCFVVDCTNLVLAVVWLWRWILTNRLASYFQSFRLSSTKPDIRSLFLLVTEPAKRYIFLSTYFLWKLEIMREKYPKITYSIMKIEKYEEKVLFLQ